MASVNKVIIVGRLGKDPEINKGVCKFTVAADEKWEGGSHVEWFRVTAFKTVGENAAKYLSKGSQVYVEGRFRTSEYESNGETKRSTEVIAHTVQFLDGKPAREQIPKTSSEPDFDDDIAF